MAGLAFPSWAYNSAGQAAVIVASQGAFNALPPPGTWSFSPFVVPSTPVPSDPGFLVTDTRLQQILIENRVMNLQLQTLLFANPDNVDLTGLRTDVLSQDSSLNT